MISFHNETDFKLEHQKEVSNWIKAVIEGHGCELGEVSYVFCSDGFLHKINVEHLDHDTLTDIISFDYSLGKQLHGEIYVSVDRVKENARMFEVTFSEELHRVMIHGVLHLTGLKDKTQEEKRRMRNAEDAALAAREFV